MRGPRTPFVPALGQSDFRAYATELLAAGASPVHELVAVFDGKRAWVRQVDEALAAP
ncbi:hypothetical protein [Chondromyces apiculatus]|uniref:Uncharacterized protein n=1 Tax=Chondromyces apiculatus DSM 436 TaxID=1192034 RepID=A0A017T0Z9_9BACT|nr:hypothetical protein [Chondromyces apiculatus]EYF02657.1 Hypothetical protein CAP_6687 [Chondromyces apiculatus DSM 436]